MLLPRGLNVLLWCALAFAASPRRDAPSSTFSHPKSGVDLGGQADHYRVLQDQRQTSGGYQAEASPHRRRQRSRGSTYKQGWMPRRLQARQGEQCPNDIFCPGQNGSFQCCGPGFTCCVGEDGNGSCCPTVETECDGEECSTTSEVFIQDATLPTVVITRTVVRTVTTGSATQTQVVLATVSQTISFLDPALSTHTATVTVTAAEAARRRVRRTEVSAPETGGVSDIPLAAASITGAAPSAVRSHSRAAEAQQPAPADERAGTVTITTTVEITTTVPGIVTVTSTFFNTVFVTLTFAPRASTTVFFTRTVRPTDGATPTGGRDPPSRPPGIPDSEDPAQPSGTDTDPGVTASLDDPDSNPTASPGTPLPPGATPSRMPGGPQSMRPDDDPEPTPSRSPNTPARPIPGSNLTSDEIAGIALGIIFGLLFLILAAFLGYRLIKKKQALELMRSHQEMSSSAHSGSAPLAAGSMVSAPTTTQDRLTRPPPAALAMGAGALASDGTSGTDGTDTPGAGEVRIVIRPAPKRRTPSSQLFPPSGQGSRGEESRSSASRLGLTGQWPRPPGYTGQTYSFFVEESGGTTPQDPGQWSVASDDGSRHRGPSPSSEDTVRYDNSYGGLSRAAGPSSGGGGGGGVGGDYLGVGRALSPWKPV